MRVWFALEDWTAAGHASSLADQLTLVLGSLALGVLLTILLRALARQGQYRAVGVLSEADVRALREQIADAERRTKGEIGLVVLEESDAHPQGSWLAALAFVLAASVFVPALAPSMLPALLLPALLASGAAGYWLARALPAFRRSFVSGARAGEMAEEQALQEFSSLGMHRTEGRTGVLILISLFEHAVIVLADDGIHSRVGDDAWRETTQRVLAGVRSGSLAQGLKDGIGCVATVLEKHCPRIEPHANELPDHVMVRRS